MRKIFLGSILMTMVVMIFVSCAPMYDNELNEEPATTYQIDVWNFSSYGRNIIIVPEKADGAANFEAIDWRNGENLFKPEECKKISFQLGQKFAIYWGAKVETNADGEKELTTEDWPYQHWIIAENEINFDEYKIFINDAKITMVKK